jgi:Right handed beta helix region
MTRLPQPGGDDDTWGDILNAYLEVSLNSDGTLTNNVVGTAQLQNNCVTNAKLDSPTQTTLASVAGKYTLPSGGIPSTDLTSSVQTSLGKANTSEQTANKGVAGGYASLDGSALLPISQLPGAVVSVSQLRFLVGTYGAVGNCVTVTDGAMSSGSATLVCATSTPFTSTAVDGGKYVCVNGAGAAGAPLVTTITSITDSGHAVLAVTSSATVSGKSVVFGTDDTAAFQAANNAASAVGGGEIDGAAKSYLVGSITPSSHVHWQLARGATITQRADTTNSMFNNSTTAVDMSWTGLHLIGVTPVTPSQQRAIFISPSSPGGRIRLTDCIIENFDGSAAEIANSDGVTITGNQCFNIGVTTGPNVIDIVGYAGNTTSDIVIANNIIENTPTAGIAVVWVEGQAPGQKARTSITGNVVKGASWAGIVMEVAGGACDIAITGNTVLDCVNAIEIGDTSGSSGNYPGYVDMQNCTISGNTIDCGAVVNSFGIGVAISNAAITGNAVRAYAPVFIFPKTNCRITNNTIVGNTFICCSPVANPQTIGFIARIDSSTISGNHFATESETDFLSLSGVTAGTFTLTIASPQTTYSATAAINYNATAVQVQTALLASLPASLQNAVTCTSAFGGLPGQTVEITFLAGLGGQPITVTPNFTGLTGGSPTLTRQVTGATSLYGLYVQDSNQLHATGNAVAQSGRCGIRLDNCRDGIVSDNVVHDPNANATSGVNGAGIYHQGDVGTRLVIRNNTVVDRRVTPLMTYGLALATAGFAGTPVVVRDNFFIGWVTSAYSASNLMVPLDGNIIDSTGTTTYASPALTGTPTAPTPANGDTSTKIATTAFVAGFTGAIAPTITTASNASLPVPSGGGHALITAVGGGGGGGGGGSAAATQLQVGGSGGSSGVPSSQLVSLGGNTTLNVTIGAGGAGGGGGAAGGQPGGAGILGGTTTVTGTGIGVTGGSGGHGAASAASSTTSVTSVAFGAASGQSGLQIVATGGGSGNMGGMALAQTGGGGGGGGAATTTNGGGSGGAGTAQSGGAGGTSGASGTAAGLDGTSAAANTGAGGGGGGGGAAGTGAGGNGGTGGSGFVTIIWFI